MLTIDNLFAISAVAIVYWWTHCTNINLLCIR